MQENLVELVEDKNARLVYLQLLAPDKTRYMQAELKEVVHPSVAHPKAAAATKEDQATAEVCLA